MSYLLFNVKDIAELIKRCQDNKYDFILIIDGKRGNGKSTLGYKVACKTSDKIHKFRPSKDICFTRDDVIRGLAKKIKGIIMGDEFINVTYNRDFYSEEQKQLIKMLNMYRDSCNLLIACVPNFFDLDKQFRALCKMRINVVRRGYGIIHTQNKSSYSTDPWDLKINEKIERKWMERKTKNPQYSKLTTFRGVIKFGDLSPKSRDKYEHIKKTKRNVIFETGLDDEDKKKKSFFTNITSLIREGKLNKEQVMQMAMVNNIDYKMLVRRVNIELKVVKDHRTMKDFFVEKKKKEAEHKRNSKDSLSMKDIE